MSDLKFVEVKTNIGPITVKVRRNEKVSPQEAEFTISERNSLLVNVEHLETIAIER